MAAVFSNPTTEIHCSTNPVTGLECTIGLKHVAPMFTVWSPDFGNRIVVQDSHHTSLEEALHRAGELYLEAHEERRDMDMLRTMSAQFLESNRVFSAAVLNPFATYWSIVLLAPSRGDVPMTTTTSTTIVAIADHAHGTITLDGKEYMDHLGIVVTERDMPVHWL